MSRVLVIGDCHCPVMLPGYVEFLRSIHAQWKCDRVIHIGDVTDFHCVCYHEKNPDAPPPAVELAKAKLQVKELEKAFPKLQVMTGNHDALPKRKAVTLGIPVELIKSQKQIWDTRHWVWMPRYGTVEIDGVLYRHGDKGKGGQNSATINSRENFKSLVQGHHHQLGFVQYYANETARCFGLQTGCGIDWGEAQLSYGMKFNNKPVISCGVVIDGKYGYCEPMELS